jgi:hypothetical protein
MLKVKGIYCVVIGACMILMWTALMLTGQIAELASEPYRILAHIFSEILTAVLLIAGGVGILKRKRDVVLSNVALGALLYSVLTAGGYYLQKNDVGMTAFFAVLTLATISILAFTLIKAGGNARMGDGEKNRFKA